MVLSLGILGLTAAYPPAAFSMLIVLSGAVAITITRLASSAKSVSFKVAFFAILLLAVVGIVTLVTINSSINWLFLRPAEVDWSKGIFKIWATLVLGVSGGGSLPYQLWLTSCGLFGLFGVHLLWRQQYTKWVALSWGVALALVLGTFFPIPFLLNITALWYYGSYRLMPILAIISIIALTQAFITLGSKLKLWINSNTDQSPFASYQRLGALCAVLLLIGNGAISWETRAIKARELYKPAQGQLVFMASSDELAMIFRAKDWLTDDKVILGEASTGAALIYIITGHPVAYKQVTWGSIKNADPDSRYLADNFANYKQDPKVCEIVREYNIGYFYSDRSNLFNYEEQKTRAAGLFGVVLDNNDFVLLDKGGTAELYKFVGCDNNID